MALQSMMKQAGFETEFEDDDDFRIETRKAFDHWTSELHKALAFKSLNLNAQVREKFISRMRLGQKLAAEYLNKEK